MFLFHTLDFISFFLLVFVSYWIAPRKWKNPILLIASYCFYASWDWRFLSLLLLSTLIDYFCALGIYSEPNGNIRRIYLYFSIFVNLSLLGFFKYYDFFVENLRIFILQMGIDMDLSTLGLIIPLGISFYTFQTLSYTIDIYRGKIAPTKNIIDYALYV